MLIITMIKWIRTSRLSIKTSLYLQAYAAIPVKLKNGSNFLNGQSSFFFFLISHKPRVE